MNVWNGADPLPENVNGMYGPQYANALMGGNIASGISAGGFNNSAVRNIPPGKPRKSNVGIAMQRANSQTVVNVPSDFLPGHRNSIFSGNSFPISSQNDVFSTRHLEAPYPGNMAAQTSFGNNRAGEMPSLPEGRQWSQAVF